MIRRKAKSRAFTLIEILTVIFIFGILVSITGYVYGSSLARSRDTQRKTDMNTIKTTLEQYYLENKEYPVNTSYKNGLSSHPWVAKYELEKYVLKDPGCDSEERDPDKSFLAPHYIITIPEDPHFQIQSSLRKLGSDCQLISTAGGNVAGYGQYIYASKINDVGVKAHKYILMARLERETFVSKELFDLEGNKYALTSEKIDTWGLNYCSKEDPDPIHKNCTHNYYLSTSNND